MHDCLLSTRPTSDVYVVSSRESANAALPDAIALSTPVSLFEHWINAVWDGKIALPLPEGIQTVGQLIAWLSNREPVYIPFSIRQTIRELAEQELKMEHLSDWYQLASSRHY
jgi:hypothetical protein